MTKQQTLTCYLCKKDNRIPNITSGTSSLRCGACEALLVKVIACPSCGTKNRVKVRFVEHHSVTCGKCQSRLKTSFDIRLKKRSASKQILCNALKIKGKLHQWRGNWETAIQLFRQAQKCGASTPAELTKLSVSISLCQLYLGKRENAANILSQIDISGLHEFAVAYELARAYGLLEQHEKSLLYFQKARNAVADHELADHLDVLIDQLCVLCETDEPAEPAIRTNILLYDALRDYESDNIQAGVRKLTLAKELDPENPEISQQLGIGLLQQGKFDQAVEMLERGLEFYPSDEQAQFALGDAYFHLGLYECALNAYKQTLHLNPQNIDAYHHLGLVYEQQGEIEFAKGYWEDILMVNPLHQDAITCLSRHDN